MATSQTSLPFLSLPSASPALVQLLEEVVDLIEVWPHLWLFRPTLFHDVDGVGGSRALRHRRPDHRGRLLEAGDDL